MNLLHKFALIVVFYLFISFGFINDLKAEEPKVALVLSGGGAAGIAHVGILKVLDEINFPIDIVTGTSMGGLVGALYAIGYSAIDIEAILIEANLELLFTDSIDRDFTPPEDKLLDPIYLISLPVDNLNIRLPLGAISGHQMLNLISRLTWTIHHIDDFSQLPRPFQTVATDLETGKMVTLDSGMLPIALRASMSIPSAFEPVKIGDKILVDGGLRRNLPVQNALDLGADFVISVNASSDLRKADKIKGLNDVLAQTIAISIAPNMHEQELLSNFHLAPDLSDVDISSFDQMKDLIKLGEDTARMHIDQLKAIADSLNALKPSYKIPNPPPMGEPVVYVTELKVVGVSGIFESVVRSAFDLENGWKSLSEIERGLNRLYGMRYFDQAHYRLDSPGDTTSVTLFVNPVNYNTFNIGFRYDNWTKTSLILSLNTKGVLLPFSTIRFTGKLGDELMLRMQYFTYTNTTPKLAVYAKSEYQNNNFDIIEESRRLANVESDILSGEVMFGPLYSDGIMFGAGYHWDLYRQTPLIGITDLERNWTQVHQVFAQFFWDNLDKNAFPNKGIRWIARTSWSIPFVESSQQFSHHFFEIQKSNALSDKTTLVTGLKAGQTFGSDIPLHRTFFLGTSNIFPGYRRQALKGNGLLASLIGVQYEFYRNWYFTPMATTGNTYDKIYEPSQLKDVKFGWGLSLGWSSVIGPVTLTAMGNPDNPLFLEMKAGFNF